MPAEDLSKRPLGVVRGLCVMARVGPERASSRSADGQTVKSDIYDFVQRVTVEAARRLDGEALDDGRDVTRDLGWIAGEALVAFVAGPAQAFYQRGFISHSAFCQLVTDAARFGTARKGALYEQAARGT